MNHRALVGLKCCITLVFGLVALSAFCVFSGCGSSDSATSSGSRGVGVSGRLLVSKPPPAVKADLLTEPVIGAKVSVAGTIDYSITGSSGTFALTTTYFGFPLELAIEAPDFVTSFRINSFPAGAMQVQMVLEYNTRTNNLEANYLVFTDAGGNPVGPTPLPTPDQTPQPKQP